VQILTLIGSRILLSLLTLLLVSLIIFAAVEVLPGDAATRILGREATPATLATLRAQLHLEVPAPLRYLHWLGGAMRGDFGTALTSARPISVIVAPKLFNTLVLALAAFLLYLPLAVIPAVVQAVRRDRPIDHGLSAITLALLSTPDFLLGTILLFIFAATARLLPTMSTVDESSTFAEYLYAIALPAMTLAIVMAVYAVRMLRDNLIEVLDSDFVRMAELKGLSRGRVMLRHALPNALIPSLNVTALNVGYVIGGVVVVEQVFSYPGLGNQMVNALQLRDYPLFEATVLIASGIYIVANLLADVGAILLNPRLRSGR
jgi:peptide/nickel transport system permease protein